MAVEDFNKIKALAKRMVQAPIKHGWEFKLDIDGLPDELLNTRDGGITTFDILCKGISYSPITIDTEQIKAGSVTITVPVGKQPVEVSLTMRDLKDGRVRRWFAEQAQRVVNSDGTFNLPKDYLIVMTRRSILEPWETEDWIDPTLDSETWVVFPTKMGDLTYDVESEGFAEFPITFIQFNSSG